MTQIGARTTGGLLKITVANGGTGFTSAPTISFSGGGGTGATAYAHMAGTQIRSIAIYSPGSGYTSSPTVAINGGGGTGAAATATAYTGSFRPMTFYKGRYNDLYGVDGMGRGIRWDGDSANVEAIGMVKPAIAPTIVGSSTGSGGYVASIQLVSAGVGYASPPTVTLSGGTPSKTARATARIANGRVTDIRVTEPGAGYQATPSVTISGGMGSGAVLNVGLKGSISSLYLSAAGSGYTTSPTCSGTTSACVFTCTNHGMTNGDKFYFTELTGGTGLTTNYSYNVTNAAANTFQANTTTGGTTNIFTGVLTSGRIIIPAPRVVFNNTNGLTDAYATVIIDSDGRITSADLHKAGTGATTSGVTASITGGAGTGATFGVDLQFTVDSVTASNTGSGYYVAPVISFQAQSSDPSGYGAAATAVVNGSGNLTGATVYNGGRYRERPTASIKDTQAVAQAQLARPLVGKYYCAIRYLDDTLESAGGPITSDISELVEVNADSVGSLTWTFSHNGLDDRVTAMELWRTSADQGVVLFRVATIQKTAPEWSGTYIDTISDTSLTDYTRQGYGMLPITLPSGQANARRFGVPPAEMAVACVFQDRAWYAVDTTGARPNSLLFSEVDEPESVPDFNELVVQENTSESDKIVALIPVGAMLLIVQTAHIYRLSYVAQPVIDASISLAGYRGVLNSQCWDVLGGVAFLVDSYGMYAFDGNNEDPISVPIDNYWREKIIDFTKADQFHVKADIPTRTVRFFYCQSGDSSPTRALCYCIGTKAWWEETYPAAITATAPSRIGNRNEALMATASGGFLKSTGTQDSGAGVQYQLRTGNMPLVNEGGSRSIAFLYKPTTADSTLNVRMHYNDSDTPRANAISSDRGNGFTTVNGSTDAALNLKKTRSALGDATGYAKAYFSGRVDDRSAGADRHIAIAVAGTQTSDAVTIHSVAVEGVK